MSNVNQVGQQARPQGLDRFQSNFRGWLEKAFAKRVAVIAAPNKVSGANLVYDIYNPSGDDAPGEHNLRAWTTIKGLQNSIASEYQGGQGSDDSDFRHYRLSGVSEQDLANSAYARMYVCFDHTDQKHVTAIGNYLQRELKFKTRSILKFKIAGPKMPKERRDSVVIWFGKSIFYTLVEDKQHAGTAVAKFTMRNLAEFALTFIKLAPLRNECVYGAGPILDGSTLGHLREKYPKETIQPTSGVSITFEPKDLQLGDWKYEFNGNSPYVSFGSLLSLYIAKALRERPVVIRDFANRVADLLVADGIDPMAIFALSNKTKRA